MSASVVASTFAQSIFVARASSAEMLTIEPRFLGICFSERDNPDRFLSPRERDEEDATFDFPKRVEPDFAIISPSVFPFEPETVE
jgi:hypothetical protein